MTLTGAYGRTYSSLAAALQDWRSGKDFQVHYMGRVTYCSCRDFGHGEEMVLRWGKRNEHAAGIVNRDEEWQTR